MQPERQVNILLVDDHTENLLALEAILNSLGHNLVKARSGEEALRYLLNQDFAVILLDVQMPGMDGFETAKLIRERQRSRHTPIIFLTAITKSETHEFRGYSLGAVDYIFKPIVQEVLQSKVAVFVELFEKTQEVQRQSEQLRQIERREHEIELAQTLEALRKSEEQYRLLFENNPHPMWVYDHETLYFLAVNDAALNKYGYSREEFLAMTVKDIRSVEDIPVLLDHVSNINTDLIVGRIVRHRKKDGTIIDVEITSHSIIFEGRSARFVLANDITERKKLEAQFLRAQRMESLGTLASGIAHDLNNVLAPILMSVQILKKKLQDERSQQILTTLEATAQRGAGLVKQVLSFGRGLEGERTIIQVRHLISEIEKIGRETFPKSVELRIDIPKDLWTISADATQLHQVLMNLCVNARDAMPAGGRLTISARNFFIDENYARMNSDAKVGPYIVISVSDTGTGIPPGILDKIFDPFFTTKEIGKGTGLGLFTVIGIIKSYGGFVNVYSEVGKGTQFKVYLPAVETTETQQAKDDLLELPTGNGELILIVDDEASICEITKASLEAYDYKTLTASDGIEAVTLYLQHKEEIRTVLTDMMMPLMDGPTTIRALQRINPEVKIIAVSGLAANEKSTEAIGLGVKTFLPKPYTADELLRTLHEVLNGK